MSTLLITLLASVILAIAIFVVYRLIKVKQQRKQFAQQRFERIMPLYQKIENGGHITHGDVLPFAENLKTRIDTYELLKSHNKTELFPAEYFTLLKGAEASLANWLEFPTELDVCPDEMEYLKRVTIDFDGKNNFVHYEVFKYKTYPPHWAAKDGWMLGVVGPFFDDSEPYMHPQATFSRANSTIDKVTPEEEARWVHQNISLR